MFASASEHPTSNNYYTGTYDALPVPQLTLLAQRPNGHQIDWNEGKPNYFVLYGTLEFQRILEMAEGTEEQKLLKYKKLSSLSKDFVHIAKRFGKIIISEQFLPTERRTINPTSVGGSAGGNLT